MAISDFNGKRVFITGAGNGIGLETAYAFADAGATIVATDISEDALKALAAELALRGQICHTYVLDVSDREAYVTLRDVVIRDHGCPHVLMNNAGIGYMGSFEENSPEIWQRTLNINVLGVVNGCQAFLNAMKSAGDARHIINIASLASRSPVPNMSAYAASKYAVEGLSEVLAMELSNTAIDVTCVHPAVINTAIVRNEKMVAPSISDAQIARVQHYYNTKGCHPRVVARDIVAAVKRGQGSLFTGPQARLTACLERFLPKSWFRSLVLAMARKAGYL